MRESTKILCFTFGVAAGMTGIGMGTQAYLQADTLSALQAQLEDATASQRQAQTELDTANQTNETLRQQLANIPLPVTPPPTIKTIVKEKPPRVIQIPPSIDSCRALPLPDDVLQRLSH